MDKSVRTWVSMDDLTSAVRRLKEYAIPPQHINGEAVYLLPLPAGRVAEAFEAGLAPFTVLRVPGGWQLLCRTEVAQLPEPEEAFR